jgi:hypothetical protein
MLGQSQLRTYVPHPHSRQGVFQGPPKANRSGQRRSIEPCYSSDRKEHTPSVPDLAESHHITANSLRQLHRDPNRVTVHLPFTRRMAGVGVTPLTFSSMLLHCDRRAFQLPCCLPHVTAWYHINIVYPTHHLVLLGVGNSTTIVELKWTLSQRDGVPIEFQHLQTTG